MTTDDLMIWFDQIIKNCWTYQIIKSFLDTKNGIMPVNLKAAFFKLRRSGGNNSALTSIQTKQGAKDDSIKNDRGSFVHSLFKRVLENLIFNNKQGIYKGE